MQISIYLLSNCNKLADFQGQSIERFFLCSCCQTFTRTINCKRYLSQNITRGFFLGLSNCSAISYLFFGISIIFHKLLAQSFDYLVLIFEMTCFLLLQFLGSCTFLGLLCHSVVIVPINCFWQ